MSQNHEWRTNTGYSNEMKSQVIKPSTHRHNANWRGSFDRKGWSYCGYGRYMTGLYWSDGGGSDPIYGLKEAKCSDAPPYLYPAQGDWLLLQPQLAGKSTKGWSTCNNGYYMTGLYRTERDRLFNIEVTRCCRSKSQVKSWGSCYNHNEAIWFDRWSSCADGYYMARLYRQSCHRLYCLEEFKCCKMGTYNRNSWVEKPDLVIKA